jgi:hypothetical protein
VKYDDPSKHFRFIGTWASCQLEAEINVHRVGSWWKSDPLNTLKCDVAIMGKKLTVVTTTVESASWVAGSTLTSASYPRRI